ncbi:jg15004 [Pararge aegeria aegeria]|uniref:Jg15004 protein n=1 Tax=Pararge aegeria aegeria TaxID=348720 RepID=A0A8S4QG89_9NEOP|nr:jg15004 [Pararge aegeria aegeria]
MPEHVYGQGGNKARPKNQRNLETRTRDLLLTRSQRSSLHRGGRQNGVVFRFHVHRKTKRKLRAIEGRLTEVKRRNHWGRHRASAAAVVLIGRELPAIGAIRFRRCAIAPIVSKRRSARSRALYQTPDHLNFITLSPFSILCFARMYS